MISNRRNIALAIAICSTVLVFPAYGQNPEVGTISYANLVRKEYGLDHELVNGVQYYNRYAHSKGHPYFPGNQYRNGSLLLDGRMYSDLRLKFDIYAQQVELETRRRQIGIFQVG